MEGVSITTQDTKSVSIVAVTPTDYDPSTADVNKSTKRLIPSTTNQISRFSTSVAAKEELSTISEVIPDVTTSVERQTTRKLISTSFYTRTRSPPTTNSASLPAKEAYK